MRCTAERREPQGKPGCRSEMGFSRCRNFVQRAAYEPTAKRRVDRGNAEGEGAGTVRDPRCSLQSQEVSAKLRNHH